MTSYELEHNASISVGFFWPFPHSQIYAEPKRLFAEGLVELEEEDGGRRRKTWSITDDGRRALRAWLARPSDPAQIRDPALLKLFFASADPDAVPAIAKERIARQEHALGFLDRPALARPRPRIRRPACRRPSPKGCRLVIARLRSHPLTSFFVMAYLGSWIVWSPMTLGTSGLNFLPIALSDTALKTVNVLGLLAGPFLASIIMTKICYGTIRAWRRPWHRARPWWLWLVVLIGGSGVLFAAYTIITEESTITPGIVGPALVITPPLMFIGILPGGPLEEEVGWRGFAQPILQQRIPTLIAAILIGVLWALWHLPLFAVDPWDTPNESIGDVAIYALAVVLLSIFLAWVYNRGGGSVLLAMIAHNVINWTTLLWPHTTGREILTSWPVVLGGAVLAFVAVVVSRGTLAAEKASAPGR